MAITKKSLLSNSNADKKVAANKQVAAQRISSSPLSLAKAPVVKLGKAPMIKLGKAPMIKLGKAPMIKLGKAPMIKLGKVYI